MNGEYLHSQQMKRKDKRKVVSVMKQYIEPTLEVYQLDTVAMMASSIQGNGTTSEGGVTKMDVKEESSLERQSLWETSW